MTFRANLLAALAIIAVILVFVLIYLAGHVMLDTIMEVRRIDNWPH